APIQGTNLAHARVPDGDVTSMAALHDGRVCAAFRNKDRSYVVRLCSHALAKDSVAFQVVGQVRAAGLFPGESVVILGLDDGTVRECDLATGGEMRAFACPSPVLAVEVNADHSRILAGCADGTARLWDRLSRTELRVVRHRAGVRAV